jgi:hypothetical protein
MNPSEFFDVLARLRTRLAKVRQRSSARNLSRAEQTSVRSLVGAWFSQYQPSFIQMVGADDAQLREMDEMMQQLLRDASSDSERPAVVRTVGLAYSHFADNLLVRISRAYWSRAPERSLAGFDGEVAGRLRRLDAKISDSYEQGVSDVETSRLSYRGPAAEIREVLTYVLHRLAPNAAVMATNWYQEARRTGAREEPTPTRAERTKFILRSQIGDSASTEAAESYMSMVEERLGHVIGRTFARSNAATHAGAERDELIRLLPYINALLRELLPSTSR